MSVKKFKFISPGVFIDEIDNSQIPRQTEAVGPVIIGRTERGPAMEPYKVHSLSEFVEVFGNPIPGNGDQDWRLGNYSGPTYAAYAAMAYLRAGVGPVTMVKLLGTGHQSETTSRGDGMAGWTTGDGPNTTLSDNDGAYGLFMINSGSEADDGQMNPGDGIPLSGTLAAVWYMTNGYSLMLSGNLRRSTDATTGSAALIKSDDTSGASAKQFTAVIKDSSGNIHKKSTFNFDTTSDLYIRNVFNTNPALTNSDVVQSDNLDYYWLGEVYDRNLGDVITGSTAGDQFGCILGLESGSVGHHDMKGNFQDAQTGWFFSQDLTNNTASYDVKNMQKLFKLKGRGHGEWLQSNLKVSLLDIKAPTNYLTDYGSFTLILRRIEDTDNAVRIVERYSNLNLDPNSPNYIAKRIGDQYYQWDDDTRRLYQYGNYSNNSHYVYVEVDEDVDEGSIDSRYLPFGVYGPLRYSGFTFISGAAAALGSDFSSTNGNALVKGGGSIPYNHGANGEHVFIVTSPMDNSPGDHGAEFSASIAFPAVPLRVSASDGGVTPATDAYFGFQTTTTKTSLIYDRSIPDHLRPLAMQLNSFAVTTDTTTYQWIFSLDDIVSDGSSNAYYASGSRQADSGSTPQGEGGVADASSITALSSSWTAVLDANYNRFTAPFYGGFNGLDITEREPFRNSAISSKTQLTHYAYNTIQRAIDTVSDPEFVEMNALTVPGLTDSTLQNHLIKTCEDRADALAVVDLSGDYTPTTENANSQISRAPSISTTISNLQAREMNSSYACCFFPWVRILDTIRDQSLWVPPSVVALGTFASSERASEVWFAPAGFNRGGLSQGAGGWPVTSVKMRLTSQDRDDLYAANINPIAKFPSEGIVIFGQKTLQVTPSALDRINVRRLMIFLKKEISRRATRVLFDQNVMGTWLRFKALVEPFLTSVITRLGLTEYKLILDETTTTPDLVDRNIMYAKIFLKPARAIEYIAIDFVITRTGASFDD